MATGMSRLGVGSIRSGLLLWYLWVDSVRENLEWSGFWSAYGDYAVVPV